MKRLVVRGIWETNFADEKAVTYCSTCENFLFKGTSFRQPSWGKLEMLCKEDAVGRLGTVGFYLQLETAFDSSGRRSAGFWIRLMPL